MLNGCDVPPPLDLTPAATTPRSKSKGKRLTAERFGVLNAFVDCSLHDLTRVEALTWFVLYRDTRNGTACTSADDIGRRIGCSRRAVTAALGSLRRRGLLVQVYQGGINRGPSRYRVSPLGKSSTPGKRTSLALGK